jgi:hypothetical protein
MAERNPILPFITGYPERPHKNPDINSRVAPVAKNAALPPDYSWEANEWMVPTREMARKRAEDYNLDPKNESRPFEPGTPAYALNLLRPAQWPYYTAKLAAELPYLASDTVQSTRNIARDLEHNRDSSPHDTFMVTSAPVVFGGATNFLGRVAGANVPRNAVGAMGGTLKRDPGLDMSPAARKARAQEQGFDIDKAYFHGSTAPFRGMSDDGYPYFTDRPDIANYYAFGEVGNKVVSTPSGSRVASRFASPNEGGAFPRDSLHPISETAQITPAWVKSKKVLRVTDGDYDEAAKKLGVPKDAFGASTTREDIADIARTQGYDLVEFRNVTDVGGVQSQFLPLRPDVIRSPQAAFDPAKADSANILFADAGRKTGPGAVISAMTQRELDPLGYYSQASEAAKALKQNKGTTEQMLAQLKRAGVKDAEIEATGLRGALEGQSSVTKDEIVRHLEGNRTKLNEVRREWTDDIYTPGNITDYPRPGVVGEGKWIQYSLDPLNPTYRETVLHLDGDLAPPARNAQAFNPERLDRHSRQLTGQNFTELDQTTQQNVLASLTANTEGLTPSFRTGHFPESNIIAHARTSLVQDAKGRKIFNVDELQSDWGQKIRVSGGGRDDALVARLERQRAVTQNEARLTFEALEKAKQEFSPTHPMVSRAQKAYDRAGLRQAQIEAEYTTAANQTTPGNPLVNTTDQWVNTSLRRMIRQAVDEGADAISIPSGDTVIGYRMGGKESGVKYAYDQMYPKNLRNILRKIDKSIAPEHVDSVSTPSGKSGVGSGFTVFPITDKIRQSVLTEGQPLFAKSNDPVLTATAAAGRVDKKPSLASQGKPKPVDELAAKTWEVEKTSEIVPPYDRTERAALFVADKRAGTPKLVAKRDAKRDLRPRQRDGSRSFSYEIKRRGERFGEVGGTISPDGKRAWIEWIGKNQSDSGPSMRDFDGPNEMGVKGIRAIRDQIRKDFPDVTIFEGNRVSGARKGKASKKSGTTRQTVKLLEASGDPVMGAIAAEQAEKQRALRAYSEQLGRQLRGILQ